MNEPAVLLTMVHKGQAPTTGDVARELGVPVSAVDPDYPAALIDPAESLYAVRIVASALADRSPTDETYRGPFADPPIGTFGPPR